MSNEHVTVTDQQAAEGFAYLRALLSLRAGQPKPDAPGWIEEAKGKDEAEKAEQAAESARAKTIAEVFGRVKAQGPYTAADARVGLDDRGEAQGQTNETEDYEND